MTTRKERSVANPDAHKKEWLNLSPGSSSSSSKPTTSMKGYKCNFCGRKFYSPQALGGHQNGHRRERDAVRRYHDFKINQSIDVHSNFLVPNPAIDHRQNSASRLLDNGAGFGVVSVQPFAEEESVELKWQGSFYFSELPASKKSDQNSLDLNLKL